ncbi:hypothetical protein COT29_04345 [Candidatus Micrarchaeota archaeon CG08_land_8_20_14_0_20_59_11]|nr:MAG: hypothetical protein COT29_04345 [Candidatus Micrarchaeota archaeon CG08_land_8_20_14_0_20_59_11]
MEILMWAVVAVILLMVLWLVMVYNGLISLRLRAENALAQIDVMMTKRFDLIPNLVATVKGYAKHEREVFENVTKARAAMSGAGTLNEKAAANNMLTKALKTLFAVAEAYPALRANENFVKLQDELTHLEEQIAYSRSFYNDTVQMYNTKLQVFPDSFVANTFGFVGKDFFGAPSKAKEVPKVEF